MTSKPYSYKSTRIAKPYNISGRLVKRIVDECGKDYCITVQDVVNLLSDILSKQKKDTITGDNKITLLIPAEEADHD